MVFGQGENLCPPEGRMEEMVRGKAGRLPGGGRSFRLSKLNSKAFHDRLIYQLR